MNVEHVVQNLQQALVAAMEEVDLLRSQMYAENGKLQREFRETVDVLVQAKSTPQGVGGGFGSPNRSGKDLFGGSGSTFGGSLNTSFVSEVLARVEYLEVSVKALQERRDSAPIAVDTMLQQTRAFLQQTDEEVRKIHEVVDDRVRLMDAKLSELGRLSTTREQRMQEMFESARQQQQQLIDDVVGNLRRREQMSVEQRSAAMTDLETRLHATSSLASHMDKRIAIMEESIAQVDGEHRDLVSSVNLLRSALVAGRTGPSQSQQTPAPAQPRGVSPTRGHAASSPTGTQLNADNRSFVVEDVLRAVDARVSQAINSSMQLGASNSSVLTQPLEWRAAQNDILAVRQDLVRCVAQVERLMEDSQRLSAQQHSVLQTVQRVEQHVDAVRDVTNADLKSEFARLESLQKTFFSRQEQIFASERHQLNAKVAADVQKMHQRHADELQKAEFRRLEDIRVAQQQLRDDFNKFVEQQRSELQLTVTNLDTTVKASLTSARDGLVQEMSVANDENRRAQTQAVDEVRKTSFKTVEDLKRVKKLVEDFTDRSNEQNKFMAQRMQQVVDAEVSRFDKLAADFTLRLQHQIDEEVSRVVASQEDTIKREVQQLGDTYQRDIRNLRDEVQSLRSSLQTVAAPTAMMMSLDTRVDAIRNDIYDLHEAIARINDTEARITSHVTGDFRATIENLRSEMVRDVGAQLSRFDRALVELSKEQANRNADMDVLNEKMNSIQMVHPQGAVNQQPLRYASTGAAHFGQKIGASNPPGTPYQSGPLLPQNRGPVMMEAPSSWNEGGGRGSARRDTSPYRRGGVASSANRHPGTLRLSSTPSDIVDSLGFPSSRGGLAPPPQNRHESPDKGSLRDRFAGIANYSSTPPVRRGDPLLGVFSDLPPGPSP